MMGAYDDPAVRRAISEYIREQEREHEVCPWGFNGDPASGCQEPSVDPIDGLCAEHRAALDALDALEALNLPDDDHCPACGAQDLAHNCW